MPSAASTRLRLELQATNENFNTWGAKLNASALQLVEEAIAGVTAITVNAAVVLTSTNYASDQARMAVLQLSGAGGFTITAPAVQKTYLVDNGCAAAVTLTAGAGSVSVLAGERAHVYCDGTNFFKARILDAQNQRLQNLAAPTAGTDAATKTYVDGLVAGSAWALKTAAYNLVAGDRILANTSGGAFTMTLPAAPATGAEINVIDAMATWGTNNLTIGRNGLTIANDPTDLVCNVAGQRVTLVYTGVTWAVG